MNIYDLIVIGGGPAGIFAAIYAAKNRSEGSDCRKEKTISEKKILVAGSGKCNISHEGEINYFLTRYGDNGKFLKNPLYKYKPQDLIKFLEERGLKIIAFGEMENIFPKL